MTKIAFIGGGNMGFALAGGLRRERPEIDLVVSDPIASQRTRFEENGIRATASNLTAIQDANVVVLAVKPQIIEDVCNELTSLIDGLLVISIAAGTPLAKLQTWLGEATPIVRCMPNTPALIGQGITGMLANDQTSQEHRAVAEDILGVCGETLWFDSDDDLDKVTALSGSGPAYFFRTIEALVEAGTSMGLDRATALRLVIQTAIGASAMAAAPDADPTQLRENVTSPGGTTEAALKQLDEADISDAFVKAVQAAYTRAQELAN